MGVVFPSCSSDRGCISSNGLTSCVRLVRSVSGLFLFMSRFLMQLFYVESSDETVLVYSFVVTLATTRNSSLVSREDGLSLSHKICLVRSVLVYF